MIIIEAILLIAGILSLFFGLIPTVLYGICNIGTAALLLLAAACFLQVYLLCKAKGRQKPWEVFADSGRTTRILRSFLAAVLALFFAAEATLSAVMVWYGWGNKPYYSKADTAVVMGAEVRDGAPSKIFQSRLEKALGYLTDLPDTRVVVTGGQGKKETRAEGDVAAEWLTAKGIAPERIIIDNQSLDTYENMENTARLLAENGLPPKVVIFTDGCHQMRSQLYAKMNGMTATGIASPTPWGLFPAYWLREQAGICEAVLIKYGVLANRR